MNLFIKYPIPSDLLPFDPVDEETGAEVVGATAADKLTFVKHHVLAINQMLDEAKEEEIAERPMEEEFKGCPDERAEGDSPSTLWMKRRNSSACAR